MKSRDLFGWRDVMRVLGLSRQQVQRFVRLWSAPSGGRQSRSESRRLLSPRQVVALAIMQEMRGRGFSLDQAGAAARWFLQISPWELSQSVLSGRYLVLCVGDALPPPGRLMSEGEIYRNEHMPLSELTRLPVPFAVLDVRATMVRVCQLIEGSPEPIELAVPTPERTKTSQISNSTGTFAIGQTTSEFAAA